MEIFKKRIERLAEKLRGKADCALVTDDINRRYLTGMKSSAGYVLVFPEETVLVIDTRPSSSRNQPFCGSLPIS